MTQWEVGSEFPVHNSSLSGAVEANLQSPEAWRLPPGECRLVQNGRAALLTAVQDAGCSARLMDAWLPSYLCASMVQPFRQSGLQVHYYPVDGSLGPIDGLWAREVGHGSIVVYVNYFGFPVPVVSQMLAQRQCECGAIIVSDMTHGLLNRERDEMPRSSYVVASLRKWAGLPDGGLVWKRGSRFASRLDVDSTDGGFGRTRLVAGLMKGLYYDGILSTKDAYRALFDMAEEMANDCTSIALMSRVSRAVWSQLDCADTVSARRTNYAVLAAGISQLRGLRLFRDTLPQGVCPLGCPVVSPCRDDLRDFLTRHDVYCPIHWQLPPEVVGDFPTSQSVSATILTLPCDQRYTTDDMDRVVNLLAEWEQGQHRSSGRSVRSCR